eukprot:6201786-Pleurochrysis_carterae.AAC.3
MLPSGAMVSSACFMCYFARAAIASGPNLVLTGLMLVAPGKDRSGASCPREIPLAGYTSFHSAGQYLRDTMLRIWPDRFQRSLGPGLKHHAVYTSSSLAFLSGASHESARAQREKGVSKCQNARAQPRSSMRDGEQQGKRAEKAHTRTK